jgi:hypothetical protein
MTSIVAKYNTQKKGDVLAACKNCHEDGQSKRLL